MSQSQGREPCERTLGKGTPTLIPLMAAGEFFYARLLPWVGSPSLANPGLRDQNTFSVQMFTTLAAP
jgi:hypothetical protein